MSKWLDRDTTPLPLVQGEDWYLELYRDENAQIVTVNAPTGTPTGALHLALSGVTTADIDIGAANTDVQAALEALRTVGAGNVGVTGSAGGPWTVTWLRVLTAKQQPVMTATWAFSTTDSSVSVGMVPHDVSTGYTAVAKVSDVPDSGVANYVSLTDTVSADGQVVLTDGAAGHVTVWIKAAKTATFTFKKAQLDVQLISGGIKEHWVSREIVLRKSVL